eukprot:452070-Alexandrium_andersonii.AAC.1
MSESVVVGLVACGARDATEHSWGAAVQGEVPDRVRGFACVLRKADTNRRSMAKGFLHDMRLQSPICIRHLFDLHAHPAQLHVCLGSCHWGFGAQWFKQG